MRKRAWDVKKIIMLAGQQRAVCVSAEKFILSYRWPVSGRCGFCIGETVQKKRYLAILKLKMFFYLYIFLFFISAMDTNTN